MIEALYVIRIYLPINKATAVTILITSPFDAMPDNLTLVRDIVSNDKTILQM